MQTFGSDCSLAQIRRQTIIWINDGLGYWHIYASLGLDEIMNCCSEGVNKVVFRVYFTVFPALQWRAAISHIRFLTKEVTRTRVGQILAGRLATYPINNRISMETVSLGQSDKAMVGVETRLGKHQPSENTATYGHFNDWKTVLYPIPKIIPWKISKFADPSIDWIITLYSIIMVLNTVILMICIRQRRWWLIVTVISTKCKTYMNICTTN